MSLELIDFAVSKAVGGYMPMQLVNKILSEYHINKITTVDSAKNYKLNVSGGMSSSGKEANKREYSKQELESLFDDIQEVEI